MKNCASQVSQLLLAVSMALALTACGDDESEPRTRVEVAFELRVGEEPFVCGQEYPDIGSPPTAFTATDARLYVHDLELIDTSGRAHRISLDATPFQTENIALLDFEDGCGQDGTPQVNRAISGSLGEGEFDALRLTVGLPAARNFINLATAPAPLNVTGMFWTWKSGFKYVKIDGSIASEAGGIAPYLLHLGASGCPGSNPQAPPTEACDAPNIATLELDGFVLGESRVVIDLQDLFADVDLTFNTEGTAPGCMSEPDDPDCSVILSRLGIDDASAQRLFKLQ